MPDIDGSIPSANLEISTQILFDRVHGRGLNSLKRNNTISGTLGKRLSTDAKKLRRAVGKAYRSRPILDGGEVGALFTSTRTTMDDVCAAFDRFALALAQDSTCVTREALKSVPKASKKLDRAQKSKNKSLSKAYSLFLKRQRQAQAAIDASERARRTAEVARLVDPGSPVAHAEADRAAKAARQAATAEQALQQAVSACASMQTVTASGATEVQGQCMQLDEKRVASTITGIAAMGAAIEALGRRLAELGSSLATQAYQVNVHEEMARFREANSVERLPLELVQYIPTAHTLGPDDVEERVQEVRSTRERVMLEKNAELASGAAAAGAIGEVAGAAPVALEVGNSEPVEMPLPEVMGAVPVANSQIERVQVEAGHAPEFEAGHAPEFEAGHAPEFEAGHAPEFEAGHAPEPEIEPDHELEVEVEADADHEPVEPELETEVDAELEAEAERDTEAEVEAEAELESLPEPVEPELGAELRPTYNQIDDYYETADYDSYAHAYYEPKPESLDEPRAANPLPL